jgi:dihydrofolate synthase/folylpolyglutamate synthase
LNYPEALAFVEGLIFKKVKPGLERTEALLSALGEPQLRFPSIHVAGTNGKGSVVALLSSVLRRAGLRVGMYTSPHLVSYRERMIVNGELITHDQFAELVGRLAPLIEEVPEAPTQFEFLTAMAFEYFAQEKVDVAVIEVGLGGRFDATNVITPRLSVITHIAFDHMHLLGTTLREIAWEKAGIIKPGVPVVTAEQKLEPLRVIEREAERARAPFYRVDPGRIVLTDFDWDGQYVHTLDWGGLQLGLLGHYERENLAIALEALQRLSPHWPLAQEAVRAGVREARWPGRCELLNREPFVIADGAHNVDGAQALIETIEAYHQRYMPQGRKWLLFGVLADKDVPGICQTLFPHFDELLVTRPECERACEPTVVQALAAAQDRSVQLTSLAEGLKSTTSRMQRDDLLCITGSLYLIGELKQILEKPLKELPV